VPLWWTLGRKSNHGGTENTEDAQRLKQSTDRIEVCAYKYDGVLHRTWSAELVRHDGPLIVLDAKFADEIIHDLLGTIAIGTHSIEYYWLNRWYNIFRFAQPDGNLRNFYCNVNKPPEFDGAKLSYVDLDLDILVEPDFSYRILDAEDFEMNARHYNYSQEVQTNARRAVAELVTMIETRGFPFADV
jgi:protein associated with RNAse G/E